MDSAPTSNLFTRLYNQSDKDKKRVFTPTKEQQEIYDAKQIEAQKKQPLWKQYAQKAFEGGVEGLSGFLGFGKETKANLAGQLLSAGLPFTSIMRGKNVYHGTSGLWDIFDANKSKPSKQFLGNVAHHFTEEPYEAGLYAGRYSGGHERIIPAKIEANNVLDLVNPNMDDLSQALSSMDDPQGRAWIIKKYKESGNKKEVLVKHLEDYMNNVPDYINKELPYDAIRYKYHENNWAVPEGTPIRSAYGNQLLTKPEEISKIKGIRADQYSTGKFPVVRK